MRSILLYVLRVAVSKLTPLPEPPPLRLPSRSGLEAYLCPDGRLMPVVAGADDDDDDDDGDDDEEDEEEGDEEDDDADDDRDDDEGDDEEDEETDEDEDDEDETSEDDLPEAVKKILRKERKARRDAERRAKRAEKKAQKAKKPKADDDAGDDDDDEDEPDPATRKLRRANLIGALQEEGYVGARAKAVSRLLDDVEYDEDDEPENLDDALEAAEEEYGKEVLAKGATPKRKAPRANAGGGRKPGPKPSLTAEELKTAKEVGMAPERYAEMKEVKTLSDFQKAEKKRRKKEAATT